MKIINNKSVEGLSRLSHYVGIVTLLQMVGQSMHLGLSFSVYGENLFVFIQTAFIVALMWVYDKTVPLYEKLFLVIFTIAYGSFLITDTLVPEMVW